MNRRRYFGILVSLFLAFLCSADKSSGASYPEKAITIIVPFAPGGTVDMCIRPLSAAAKQIMGKPIVLEYHAGGSGAVGLGILKNKNADGYTLGVTTQSCLIGQHMTKVPYDLFKDFNPIMEYADAAFGIVVLATSPWKTLKEFLDYAKANPKKIRHSSAGPGTPNALAMASLAKKFQIEWTHIPFEGASAALAALLGGHVEAYSTTMHCKPHITAGRLRLLTALGEQRIPSFPAVPTLQEVGIPITASNFNALIAPRGLPSEIVETLHQAFKKAMQDPAFIKVTDTVDMNRIYRGPQETGKYFLKLNEDVSEALKLQK